MMTATIVLFGKEYTASKSLKNETVTFYTEVGADSSDEEKQDLEWKVVTYESTGWKNRKLYWEWKGSKPAKDDVRKILYVVPPVPSKKEFLYTTVLLLDYDGERLWPHHMLRSVVDIFADKTVVTETKISDFEKLLIEHSYISFENYDPQIKLVMSLY